MTRPSPERLAEIRRIVGEPALDAPTTIPTPFVWNLLAEIDALTAERDEQQEAKLGEREHYRRMRDRREAELKRMREVADAAQRLYDGAAADRQDAERERDKAQRAARRAEGSANFSDKYLRRAEDRVRGLHAENERLRAQVAALHGDGKGASAEAERLGRLQRGVLGTADTDTTPEVTS